MDISENSRGYRVVVVGEGKSRRREVGRGVEYHEKCPCGVI